uniref:Uncharacterized protein n=1 Tax=viral metagenome TaxID=1070528 RepID=A0A6C0I429_9ZZZZ
MSINELLKFNLFYESYVNGEPIDLINEKADSNQALRDELDNKMKQLSASTSSIYYEHRKELDHSIHINILLTILATSLLYYSFSKLM